MGDRKELGLHTKYSLGSAVSAWKQEHTECKCWLKTFCLHTFGSDAQKVKHRVTRSLKYFKAGGGHDGGTGRGRTHCNRTTQVVPKNRRRRVGGGRRVTAPEIGYELFQWVVDTIFNLKTRINGTMLMHQAFQIVPSTHVTASLLTIYTY